MDQVLFRITLTSTFSLPIYGYGMMLFVALVVCTWLASRLARREGIAPERIQDMAIWVFVTGIIGARLTFMIQYHELDLNHPWETFVRFFRLWEGGLVYYGCLVGGLIGYVAAYFVFLRKYRISTARVADVIAPCLAVGLAVGRVGCLLNGCCYGNVATHDYCPAITFPLSAPSRLDADENLGLVARGLQTAAGFTSAEDTVPPRVDRVVPGSPAAESGLRDGDVILAVNGKPVALPDRDGKVKYVLALWDRRTVPNAFEKDVYDEQTWRQKREQFLQRGGVVHGPLSYYLVDDWGRGETGLSLKVRHADGQEADVGPFYPRTLALHPTQLYETISMGLLFLVLMAFYPLRRHPGEVMALFLMAYPIHRFLNEMLRHDTEPVLGPLTLSQTISIFCFALGVGLWCWLRYGQPKVQAAPAVLREPVQV